MSDFTNIEVPPAVVRHIRQQAISDCIAAVSDALGEHSPGGSVALAALREVTL